MSVTSAASSHHIGRPSLMAGDAFVAWFNGKTAELYPAYGDSIQVNDYLVHWHEEGHGSTRSFYNYRKEFLPISADPHVYGSTHGASTSARRPRS